MFTPEVDEQDCLLRNSPPVCPKCAGMARPNVLMFNDWNCAPERTQGQRQKEFQWLELLPENRHIVVIEIGAGTTIPSVRHFSQRVIHEFGGRLVRINPREFSVPTTLDVGLASGSCRALTEIDKVLVSIRD